MNQRHGRRDANESTILSGVEQLGGLWLAGGPLDGWLFARGAWHLVEIKAAHKEGWKSEFTPEQILLLARLKERGIPYRVLRTEDDVLQLFGARRCA